MQRLYPLIISMLWLCTTHGQCVTSVDFSTWTEGGWNANGNWVVTGGGSQVHQTVNGNPTFFYSPYSLMNARISGDFRTTNSDDDYMGFVFSFLDPLAQTDNYNCWLFDWKQANQSSGGYTGQRGMSLNRLSGIIPTSGYSQTFWGHQNTAQFTSVANNFGSAGWVRNFTHHFELFVTFTRAQIFIDGNLVFDHADCYWPGRFGFYNYSQQDCYYSNFQYSLYVDFENLTPTVCPGDTAKIQFINPCINLNFGLSQYQSLIWNYGDGTSDTITNPTVSNANPTHVYTQPGNYNITLRVTDSQGCTDTAMHSITVATPPAVSFSNSPPCTSTAVNFTDNSSNIVDTWQWQFGDNDSAAVQNPAHVYATPGNYNVSLTATDTNNCSSTISQAIVVSAPPVAAFTAPAACEENTSVFTDASTGNPVQWQWNFGDGNTSSVQHPPHVYSSDGNYTAMLIATNGFQCADTITQQVTVHPKPTAAFSMVNVCYPNPVTFSNSSTGAIVNNGWSFGDMQVSTQQNPTHTYAAAGGYNATLLVVTSDGCADTLTQTLMVYHKPLAAFIVPDVCQGGTSVFTNTSSIGSGSITSYEWTFGDGSPTDAQEHTSHAYTAPNTYSATLIVTSDNSCGDTITQPAMVNPNPTAAFTTANVCYGNAATFTNMSTGSITANDWGFGDNQNSSMQNPTHDYASAGSYFTQLIVTTGAGCADTTIRPIIVNPKPDAHFSIPAVCLGLSSLFTENSTGNIVSYNWNFADGNTTTQQNPYNLYAADGSYAVQLIVTSDSACLDTFTENAVVHPLPVPGFTTPAVCLNQTMSFTNTSTINSGSINQWWWDLGDGNTGTAQTPAYAYTAQGTYNVRLIATSDNNCVDSTIQTVTVYDKPVAAFTATEVCETQATVFADASAIGNGTLAQWQYDFGDAQVSSQPSPQNSYATHGTYTATLIVTSADGCTDTATQVITVNPLPVLSFSAPDVCLGIATLFSNTSTIPTGTISTYAWDLGDGNTAASVSPANTYAAFGTYTVSLTAESDKGCMQTTTQTVQVFDIPVASATSTPACYQLDNGTATALATAGTPPYNYRWNTGGVTATVTALFADNYAVTITDANSCTATVATVVSQPTGPLTIASNPLNPVIKLNDIVAVNLSNSYGDLAATYIVSPDYGLTCATCSEFDAQPYQTTEYTVTVTDTQGCTGTSQFTIMVDQALPLFIPNVFTPNSDGANDTWGVYSQAVKQLRLFVFNRWGEKVFEGDGINQTWDGTYQGKPSPAGIYTYWGDIVYLNNNTLPVKGTVTLIR